MNPYIYIYIYIHTSLGFTVWGLGAYTMNPCTLFSVRGLVNDRRQPQMRSYQVGTLRRGLCRPHIALLPLNEPYMSLTHLVTTHLELSLI